MCGIIGYIGPMDPVDVIMDGLSRLEYRGYDSAGLAVISGGDFMVRRAEGKLAGLRKKLREEPVSGTLGMGHTRWATHGKPSEQNAHPHLAGDVAVVHNGIIENYLELKQELIAKGHEFSSETDTEIAAHLIEYERQNGAKDLADAVRLALKQIRGSFALVILDRRENGMMIGARKDSPLILGLGEEGEYFLASDVPAFLAHTNRVVFLNDGDIVVVRDGEYAITDLNGKPVEHEVSTISWSPAMAEKAGYRHFMQKEIFEQPRALTDTLTGRVKARFAGGVPGRHRPQRPADKNGQAHGPVGLRNILARGPGGQVHLREPGAHAHRGGPWFGVPLPGPAGGVRRHCGGHQPVRRNGRHPGRGT